MNPLLASPRPNTAAGQDSELVFLEELLNDDCKCESRHSLTTCSGFVEYAVISCVGTEKVCANTVDHPTQGTRVRRPTSICGLCGELAFDCWTIRPI